MTNEPVPSNQITSLTYCFLEYPENDSDLSVSPQEAVIGIKTDQSAPHNRFTEIIDQLKQAYHLLRDKAAR